MWAGARVGSHTPQAAAHPPAGAVPLVCSRCAPHLPAPRAAMDSHEDHSCGSRRVSLLQARDPSCNLHAPAAPPGRAAGPWARRQPLVDQRRVAATEAGLVDLLCIFLPAMVPESLTAGPQGMRRRAARSVQGVCKPTWQRRRRRDSVDAIRVSARLPSSPPTEREALQGSGDRLERRRLTSDTQVQVCSTPRAPARAGSIAMDNQDSWPAVERSAASAPAVGSKTLTRRRSTKLVTGRPGRLVEGVADASFSAVSCRIRTGMR